MTYCFLTSDWGRSEWIISHLTKPRNIHEPHRSLSVRTPWNNIKTCQHTYSNKKLKPEAKWLQTPNAWWIRGMIIGQKRLIIKLKSDTEFPDRAVDLLCSWDTGCIPSPSCLRSVCYWPRGARGGRGRRLVQFHHNDGKHYSKHIPCRRGWGRWGGWLHLHFSWALGTHVCETDA